MSCFCTSFTLADAYTSRCQHTLSLWRRRICPMRLATALTCVIPLLLVSLACGPSSDSAATPTSTTNQPTFLLSETSATSIVQSYLRDCVLSWDTPSPHQSSSFFEVTRGGPVPGNRGQWLDVATGARGPGWSAQYYGTARPPNRPRSQDSESWLVIGVGFKKTAEGNLEITQGRWQVYAEYAQPWPVDSASRLALEEFQKPLYSFVGCGD